MNPTTATPSFKPDVLGAYTLQVSGKKDGQVSSVLVYIEAVDAPVFWREGRATMGEDKSSYVASTYVGGVYGANARAVACSAAQSESVENNGQSLLQVALLSARMGASAGDTWEGPAGTPSRVVYSEMTFNPADGQITSRLAAATSVTSCAAGDAKILDSKVFPSESLDSYLNDNVQSARFLPDGTRIAYVHGSGGKPRLTTIGFDGSGKRDVSPFQSGGPDAGGLDPDAGIPIGGDAPFPKGQLQPRWKDATHVAWVTFVGPTATTAYRSDWELYAVEDREGAKGELLDALRLVQHLELRLLGRRFDHRGRAPPSAGKCRDPDDPNLTMNLVIYRANATTKECEVVRRLTQNDVKGAVTRDLALSPDKSTVAFFSGVGDGSSFGLWPSSILSLYTMASMDHGQGRSQVRPAMRIRNWPPLGRRRHGDHLGQGQLRRGHDAHRPRRIDPGCGRHGAYGDAG